MRTSHVAALVAALGALGHSGCGVNPATHLATTVPVTGKVTYKGRPLTQGTVVFEPTDIGREAHGQIGPDGTFVLTSFKEGDGAVPGTHRVGVTGGGAGAAKQAPLKYRSPSSSNIEVEVTEGRTEYDLQLK